MVSTWSTTCKKRKLYTYRPQLHNCITSWWLYPIFKKIVKLDYFPNFPGKKNNKSLQPRPTFGPQEPMENEGLGPTHMGCNH